MARRLAEPGGTQVSASLGVATIPSISLAARDLVANADGALYRRCQAAGADILWPIETKWYRREATRIGARQFIVKDPDGYLIRLSRRLGTEPASEEA